MPCWEIDVNNHAGVMSHVVGLFSAAPTTSLTASSACPGRQRTKPHLAGQRDQRLPQMIKQVDKLEDRHTPSHTPTMLSFRIWRIFSGYETVRKLPGSPALPLVFADQLQLVVADRFGAGQPVLRLPIRRIRMTLTKPRSAHQDQGESIRQIPTSPLGFAKYTLLDRDSQHRKRRYRQPRAGSFSPV